MTNFTKFLHVIILTFFPTFAQKPFWLSASDDWSDKISKSVRNYQLLFIDNLAGSLIEISAPNPLVAFKVKVFLPYSTLLSPSEKHRKNILTTVKHGGKP